MKFCKNIFIVTSFFWLVACGEEAFNEQKETMVIRALLDDFNQAAAQADAPRYLGHFTKDGVFLGTDESERRPLDPILRPHIEKQFADGVGWVFVSEQKNIAFSPRGDVAWFDEVTVSPQWGRFRGTGVVLKEDGRWRIAHYSLTFLIPNELWDTVIAQVGEVTEK